jgi:hypothetical protein
MASAPPHLERPEPDTDTSRLHPRRRFLALTGLSAAGIFVAGCGGGDDDSAATTPTETESESGDAPAATIDFKDATIGVLNYAYALEQLEAAFYTEVNANMFSDAGSEDEDVLQDLMAHEVAHREFFKAVLGDKAIPGLMPDFSKVDFGNRESVMQTASTFENLGVWAYNGAAQFIDTTGPLGVEPLVAAGEIVSVEARHAAVIDAIINPGRNGAFASEAFDKALVPSEVLPMVEPFSKNKINVTNRPANA